MIDGMGNGFPFGLGAWYVHSSCGSDGGLMRWIPCSLSIVSCALTIAASTFLDLFNAPLFLPFLFFVTMVGITGSVGCMSNVDGGTFSLGILA